MTRRIFLRLTAAAGLAAARAAGLRIDAHPRIRWSRAVVLAKDAEP